MFSLPFTSFKFFISALLKKKPDKSGYLPLDSGKLSGYIKSCSLSKMTKAKGRGKDKGL